MRWQHLVGVGLVLPVVLAGCATGGGSDMMNYVVSTQRKVNNLDQNLTPAVKQLNESMADISTRLNSIDESSRKNGADLETAQNQLQRLEQRFDEFQRRSYGERGLSVPKAPTPPTPAAPMQIGPVVEQPLSEAPPTTPPPPAPPASSAEDRALSEHVDLARPIGPPPDLPPPARTTTDPPQAPQAPPPAPKSREVASRETTAERATTGSDANLYEQAQDAYQNKQDYAKAASLFDSYLKQNPGGENSGNAHFWKGQCLLKLSKYREAVGEFEKVRKENPQNNKMPYVLHQEANALLQLGKQKEAMDLLHELINQYPASKPAQMAKQDLKKYNLQ